ncbi:N-terminal TM domain of oligopeptide transport permease C family protein [Corynebacterium simulans]|nr:N-terminal TM domain of oligopeptide transport permease C family protein [Corynebacterium simulans]
MPKLDKTTQYPGQEHFISDVDETGLGAVDAVKDESAPSSQWGEAWRYLRRRPLFWVAAVMITLAILLALFPGLFTNTDPRMCELSKSLDPAEAGHPFGFNRQGCDIYARVIYGARASVIVGVLTTLLVVIIGALVGAIAGFFGGWIDAVLSRITDIFFAIPLVLAAIVVMQMFKEHRTIITVVLVLGLFGWVSTSPASPAVPLYPSRTRNSSNPRVPSVLPTPASCLATSCRTLRLRSFLMPPSRWAPTSLPRPRCPSSASACPPRSSRGAATSLMHRPPCA